jgi:acetyl esterase/lipase
LVWLFDCLQFRRYLFILSRAFILVSSVTLLLPAEAFVQTEVRSYYASGAQFLAERDARFFLQFNNGVNEQGEAIQRIDVVHTYPGNTAGLRTSDLLPTIFLLPGGGFTTLNTPPFLFPDSCSGKSIAHHLADAGYNVFTLIYYPTTGIFGTLLDFSVGHICGTGVLARVKYEQERANLMSFWSLRKIVLDLTATTALQSQNRIDIENMLMIGHSAGAILALDYLFLDQEEIPDKVCNGNWYCPVQDYFKTDFWPIPKMKGIMAMSGGSFYKDIFFNNQQVLGNGAAPLLLMHGTCDELVPEQIDYLPYKCKKEDLFSTDIDYIRKYPDAEAKFNRLYGSGWMYEQLSGKMPVRYERVCAGGHLMHNPLVNRPYTDSTAILAQLFGLWNACDMAEPDAKMNDSHPMVDKMLSFAKSVFNNTFESGIVGWEPEMPSQKCLATDNPAPKVAGIYFDSCQFQLRGAEHALQYDWELSNLFSSFSATTSQPFLEAGDLIGGKYHISVVASNGCNEVRISEVLTTAACKPSPFQVWDDSGIMEIRSMKDDVIIEVTTASDAFFVLYDAKGALIRRERVYLERGANIFSINTLAPGLAKAMYLLQVQSPFDTQTIKLLRQ